MKKSKLVLFFIGTIVGAAVMSILALQRVHPIPTIVTIHDTDYIPKTVISTRYEMPIPEEGNMYIQIPVYWGEEGFHLVPDKDHLQGKNIGQYLPGTGIIVANSEGTALHEVGHLVDEELGLPGDTEEWKRAVDLLAQQCRSNVYNRVYCFVAYFPGINGNLHPGWGGYGELYAELYHYVVMDYFVLPQELAEFYPDWISR
jgi:hypothetical protein